MCNNDCKSIAVLQTNNECRSITVLLVAFVCSLLSKRDCEREIDWYKSVKATQGSVEVTSFGQMRNINRLGQYTVGSTKGGKSTSRADIVHLRLVETQKMTRLSKSHYTVDELRDLESKLVLITGRDSEEYSEVDHFLKVSLLNCV